MNSVASLGAIPKGRRRFLIKNVKAVMSLYKSDRDIPDSDKIFWETAALSARKHYAPLTLFADKDSAFRLTHDFRIEFDHVDTTTILPVIARAHPMCWSAGKLAAMRAMAEQGEPFFHIDGDAFVTRSLPEEITSARMFCQCIETSIQLRRNLYRRNSHYPLRELLPDLRMPPFMTKFSRLPAQQVMNMGIFGGTDCQAIFEYADLSIQTFINNAHNAQAFRRFQRSKPHFLGLACIAEQWSLGAYCNWKKIVPAQIMNRIDAFNLNRSHEAHGFVHLYSSIRRNSPAHRKWTKRKLKELQRESAKLEMAA